MDIKLKMGAKTDLPSNVDKGTVYFAKDGDKNFGELYYGDENGNKVKIGGTTLSSIDFDGAGVMTLSFEDGTTITGTLPVADEDIYGIINNAAQSFNGVKTFNDEIIVSKISFIDSGDIESTGDGISIYGDQLWIGDGGFYVNATFNEEPATLDLTAGMGLWTESLGNNSNYIPTAFIESITANTVTATAFTGLFTGNLSGNANTATTLLAGKNINGTLFDGSADIITEFWGTARNVKISNQANASVDGLSVDGARDIVLTIPSTMTNFASITSTDLFGTNLGSKTSIWDTLHIKNPIIYNPLDTSYFHKLVSKSNSTTGRTLNLPDADGTLVFITSAIGDENSPAYVASSGQVQACTFITVEHGGTGRDTLAAGSLLVGNGTSAVTLVAGDTKGKILSSNGSSSAPSYVSPSLSWVDGGASGPTLKLSINSADTTSAIPIASGTVSGVVSTGEQTFNGKKIFSGAIQGNSTLAITGTSTFTGQITAANMILTGQLKSSANTSYSYMTLADTKITLKSSAIFLDGSKLLLNTTSSNMYGTTLPTTGLEEGRVFFLLV